MTYTYENTKPDALALIGKGKAEVRFNIAESTEERPIIDPETHEPTGEVETITIYTCEKAIVDYPLDYGRMVDAMIRTRYTQGNVEAIFRHKINGDEEADEPYQEFNSFAESCKSQAQEIINQ